MLQLLKSRIIVPVFTNTVKINGEVMFSNTTPFVKASIDLRDAAKAIIALKNYRKL